MSFLIALGIYTVVLFVWAFVARRRAGLPILALVTGAFLAELWANALVPVIAKAGVMVNADLLAIILVLLPAAVVMWRSTKVHSHLEAVIASAIFALLAALLTYESFAHITISGESSGEITAFLASYKSLLITLGVVYALIDVAVKHGHRAHGKKRGHK